MNEKNCFFFVACDFVDSFVFSHGDVARFATFEMMYIEQFESRDMIAVFYYCDAQLPMFFLVGHTFSQNNHDL